MAKNSSTLVPETTPNTWISSITNEGILFYWKKIEQAHGYLVYRSYKESGPFERIAVITTNRMGTYLDAEFDHSAHEVFYALRSYLDSKDGDRILGEMTPPQKAQFRTELALEREKTYLYSGNTRELKALYGWGEAEDALWSSSDESVATIDARGIATGIAAGTCTITCRSSKASASAEMTIEVDRPALAPAKDLAPRYKKNPETGIWEQTVNLETNEAVLMMGGDMMCSKAQMEDQAIADSQWDFNSSFDEVRKVFAQSDFAIANLETLTASGWPYVTDEAYINEQYNANGPATYLDAVSKGGLDAVIMANNHNCDGGVKGLCETLQAVDSRLLARTGAFLNGEEERYLVVNINNIKVGFVAYHSQNTGFNTKDAAWTAIEKITHLNAFDPERAAADIAACRQAGAEYVIAYMHWGKKNYRKPTNVQLKEAQQIADAGADFIVGSNPHLVQNFRILQSQDRTVPCYCSIGNFLAAMNQLPGNRDSIVVRIRLARDNNGRVVLKENNYVPFHTCRKYWGSLWAPVTLSDKPRIAKPIMNEKKYFDRTKEAVGPLVEPVEITFSGDICATEPVEQQDTFDEAKNTVVKSVAAKTGWTEEKARKEIEQAEARLGCTYREYLNMALYELCGIAQEERYRQRVQTRENATRLAEELAQARGITLKEAREEMRDVRTAHNVSGKVYVENKIYELSAEEQTKRYAELAKEAEEQAKEKKRQKRVEYHEKVKKNYELALEAAMASRGWNRDEAIAHIEATKEFTGCTNQEYRLFKLFDMTRDEQQTVLVWEELEAFLNLMPMPQEIKRICYSKRKQHHYFGDYMSRAWCETTEITREEFKQKFANSVKLFYKPLMLSHGSGAQAFDMATTTLDEVYDVITDKPEGLVEEYIVQHPTMSLLSPTAVNTMRVVSVSSPNYTVTPEGAHVDIAYASLKMGGANSVVDNVLAGGYVAGVDLATGKLNTAAFDQFGDPHDVHPLTGTTIQGFEIPHFQKTIDAVRNMCEEKKLEGCLGWDIAITENGPEVVEVNSRAAALLFVLPRGKNTKGYFDKYVEALKSQGLK